MPLKDSGDDWRNTEELRQLVRQKLSASPRSFYRQLPELVIEEKAHRLALAFASIVVLLYIFSH